MSLKATRRPNAKANFYVATSAALGVVLMVGAAYAAVPLYDLFCRATGFGGTPQIVTQAPEKTFSEASGRIMTVRFDAGLNGNMPWQFASPKQAIALPVGVTGLAFYTARNLTDKVITGTATYNVLPPQAGYYFSKIDCFCFREQVLQPGEEVQMPVSFFIDPEILTDPEMESVTTITLSYTFFEVGRKASQKRALPEG